MSCLISKGEDPIQNRLIASGYFVAVRGIVHRLLFNPDHGAHQCPVDLIPFGGVEQPTHTIAWPPDMQVILNVAGYGEVLHTASCVQVDTGLVIRVASLPGLALLKLFAWHDRGRADARDAIDFVTLCRHYADAGNLDRLYEEAIPALQAVGFDVEIAGAWLLGKDTATTAASQTRGQLKAQLSDTHTRERLTNDMARALRRREDATTYAAQLLDQFNRGFSVQVEP